MNDFVFHDEACNASPTRFSERKAVMQDCEGNEVKELLCPKCRKPKIPVTGKVVSAWHFYELGLDKE